MLDGLESEQMCKPTVAPFHNQTHPQSCTTGGSNQIKYQSHCISRSDKEHKKCNALLFTDLFMSFYIFLSISCVKGHWSLGLLGLMVYFNKGTQVSPIKKVSDLGNAQIDTFFSVGLPSVIE